MSQSTAGPGNPSGSDLGQTPDAEEVVPDSHTADIDAGYEDEDESPTVVDQPEDGKL